MPFFVWHNKKLSNSPQYCLDPEHSIYLQKPVVPKSVGLALCCAVSSIDQGYY